MFLFEFILNKGVGQQSLQLQSQQFRCILKIANLEIWENHRQKIYSAILSSKDSNLPLLCAQYLPRAKVAIGILKSISISKKTLHQINVIRVAFRAVMKCTVLENETFTFL